MTEIGPVQMLVIGFGPDAKLEGQVMTELARLEESATIRILDLLFVRKEEDGDLVALDYQGEELGAIVGALLGFEFEGEDAEAAEPAAEAHAFGLSQEQIQAMAGALDPGQSAGFLLIEHVWAREFKRAIREAGGVPIAEGFLTPEAIAAVAAELVAMAEAHEEIETEGAGAPTG
jgi:uncharacterized membrane protein